VPIKLGLVQRINKQKQAAKKSMAGQNNALNGGKQLKKRNASARTGRSRAPRSRTRGGPSGFAMGNQPLLSMQKVPRQFPDGISRANKFHREVEDEYIADINGSTTFATTQFSINPGQSSTFPWLSKIASQWEKYHFEFLEFYYKREVSEFATQGQAGKVILSIDYDASDSPPSTKQQCMDTVPHSDGMPCENFSLRADPQEMENSFGEHMVRPGGLPGASDIKTYDVGNLFVSTIANTNTSLVGELHVRYICVLSVPVLESSTTAPQNNQVAFFQNTTAQSATSTVPVNALLATKSANGLSAVNTAGSFVLPAGNYLIDASANGFSSGGAANTNLDIQKNGTSLFTGVWNTLNNQSGFANDSASVTECAYASSNGTDVFTFVVTVSGGGACTFGAMARFVAV